ncbi:hypothetical protein Ahy_A04g018140 isoform A [Arachis hypogaea]|uniref:Uncharacterized protein n=1 Tax=Arachis hypogaea TaxID=3818 RepID=A0A445DD01_ARAHY|nr:hypothetical protein Ahy_A04g018140 isoform A [Arachis hypogaea]
MLLQLALKNQSEIGKHNVTDSDSLQSEGENLQTMVLFDLFRHDVRLWKAYSTTLQVVH